MEFDATDNNASLTSNEENTLTILNWMSKLDEKFDTFMNHFEIPNTSTNDNNRYDEREQKRRRISSPQQTRASSCASWNSFKPIDTIEQLDEFEENLKNVNFEQKMVNGCGYYLAKISRLDF